MSAQNETATLAADAAQENQRITEAPGPSCHEAPNSGGDDGQQPSGAAQEPDVTVRTGAASNTVQSQQVGDIVEDPPAAPQPTTQSPSRSSSVQMTNVFTNIDNPSATLECEEAVGSKKTNDGSGLWKKIRAIFRAVNGAKRKLRDPEQGLQEPSDLNQGHQEPSDLDQGHQEPRDSEQGQLAVQREQLAVQREQLAVQREQLAVQREQRVVQQAQMNRDRPAKAKDVAKTFNLTTISIIMIIVLAAVIVGAPWIPSLINALKSTK